MTNIRYVYGAKNAFFVGPLSVRPRRGKILLVLVVLVVLVVLLVIIGLSSNSV